MQMLQRLHNLFRKTLSLQNIPTEVVRMQCRWLHYVQGQSPNPKHREYFYFIDHQGQLFLDDARIKNFTSCFKEKDFLEFFFKRVKINETGLYEDVFPYISPCGRERNFIRCDDRPIVYTHLIQKVSQDDLDSTSRLSFGGAGELLTVSFEPDKICMLPESGRVYHPASERTGGIGLIESSLAIEFSKSFSYEHGDDSKPPTHFSWQGTTYTLTNELIDILESEPARFRPQYLDS
ncbi:UPF0598 protein CG30010-like [Lineus longissimus]|uniref:UPF0598 protein CG30010-like n=1 Tax=Lineus longissimus TaxID=88925 RepID=UPI002B4D6ADA